MIVTRVVLEILRGEAAQNDILLKWESCTMNPWVKHVKPNSDFTLTLTFTNDEVGIFDVRPYLNVGVFQELNEPGLFNSVKVFMGSVQWRNGQDFCPDTLYLQSKKHTQADAEVQYAA